MIVTVLALTLSSCLAAETAGLLSLSVADDGSYEVAVGGSRWFRSAATFYTTGHRTKSTADGSLKLYSSTTGSGVDSTGLFKSTVLSWDEGAFVTTFREYDDSGVIVFEQSFPQGVQGTTLNASDPMAARRCQQGRPACRAARAAS